ncbi:MAG TPA: hypothetical protein VFV67_14230 [Actinophytocola sp.]|uniref:hypothetical protein n=1 Tax=Actinophytocola sp. TaxID=1872138 RepID=UPI002DB9654E|nr:hypothetical protein [Actinophytocola sp.]HEU5471804.1 hypothetical protein [Actinophytocola sp.]
MADGAGRGLSWGVAGLCVVAGASLVNPVAVLSGGGRWFGLDDLTTRVMDPDLPFMIGAAALAAVVGVLVLRWYRVVGWAALLAVGALLSTAGVIPLLSGLDGDSRWWPYAAMGAGPVLVVLGLLGGANWLLHTAGTAVAAPVIATAFLGPLPMPFVLATRWNGELLEGVTYTLAVVAPVAAIGILVMARALRRQPVPPAPTWLVSAAGIGAGVLLLAPDLVDRISNAPGAAGLESGLFRPAAQDWRDDRMLGLGITGAAMVAAATGLAALLGRRALVATLGAGLVLYGILFPQSFSVVGLGNPVLILIVMLAGAGLGVVAAATRWRHVFAGVAGGLVALGTIGLLFGIGANPPSRNQPAALLIEPAVAAPLGWLLLAGTAFALTTGVVAAGSAVREGGRLPVALGLIAVAILVGLTNVGGLVNHSAVSGGDVRSPVVLLGLLSAVTLATGAGLIAALHRPVPAAPTEPAEPREPEPVRAS